MKLELKNVKVSAISAVVPDNLVSVDDIVNNYGTNHAEKIISSVGVKNRYIAEIGETTADLCFAAANKIFDTNYISRDQVDVLIFVSQTPDYVLPATSCVLQDRLGLSKACIAFDINLGCSGYTYALLQAATFISSGCAKKVLLLVGDTISKIISPSNSATYPLFGDAGSATVLEYKEGTNMSFVCGTNGDGARNLIVNGGGFRSDSPRQLEMGGAEVFSFVLNEIPKATKEMLEFTNKSKSEIDYFIFHQANAYMLNFLTKKMRIEEEKMIININKFGNTSSASIPLAIVDMLKSELVNKECNDVVLAGFGVGYSWCLSNITLFSDVVIPELTTVSGSVLREFDYA